MKRGILISLLLVCMAATAAAAADSKCKTINYKQGGVYTIKAALHKGTHIQLPERLMFPPQAGDSDLWTIEGNGHHVMVQPNSAEFQGAKTNLTLITESNTAYHFELQRVPFNEAYSCVVIEGAAKFFESTNSQSGPDGQYRTPTEQAQLELQNKVLELQQALTRERTVSSERIDDVVAKYRSMIYTRYKWSGGSGFKGTDLVTDVWDDGRFTYIRVHADHRGMLAAKAQIDGKEEMIEYKPDSDYVYKISGIFPQFELLYGQNNKVTVKRRDNQSNGVY
jgi:type IV secretory pathway VirB9-like protein